MPEPETEHGRGRDMLVRGKGVNSIELSVLRCNEISILRSAKSRSVVYNGVYMVQHFSQTQSSQV